MIRHFGGIFRPRETISLSTQGTSAIEFSFEPYIGVPAKSDVLVRASNASADDFALTTSYGIIVD